MYRSPAPQPAATIWHFSKMHGAGNDFVMLDGVTQDIELKPGELFDTIDFRLEMRPN